MRTSKLNILSQIFTKQTNLSRANKLAKENHSHSNFKIRSNSILRLKLLLLILTNMGLTKVPPSNSSFQVQIIRKLCLESKVKGEKTLKMLITIKLLVKFLTTNFHKRSSIKLEIISGQIVSILAIKFSRTNCKANTKAHQLKEI